jgi:uncharacterized protein (DUF2267 family)
MNAGAAPTMNYRQFVATVQQGIGEHARDADQASEATRATLETLGQRIDREEARQLASQLPVELAPWVATPTPAQRFDADEFVRRVGEREGVDMSTAQRHVRAVLDALARAVPQKEWSDVLAELPRSFAPLLPQGPHLNVLETEAFLSQVAARAGIDLEAADRATDAVLETLAERIAGGEVEDLMVRLPTELHLPLERGRARVRGQAEPMRIDKFIETVATREGVAFLDAALHVRVVLLVLRDAVGEQEFLDVTVQLPDEYRRLIAP